MRGKKKKTSVNKGADLRVHLKLRDVEFLEKIILTLPYFNFFTAVIIPSSNK